MRELVPGEGVHAVKSKAKIPRTVWLVITLMGQVFVYTSKKYAKEQARVGAPGDPTPCAFDDVIVGPYKLEKIKLPTRGRAAKQANRVGRRKNS